MTAAAALALPATDHRCPSCGYGVARGEPPPRCPMCGREGEAWLPWPRRLAGVGEDA